MPSKPPAPSDLADKFMLRLPDGMRDRISAIAKANGRSMNAEIVHRLEESLVAELPQPRMRNVGDMSVEEFKSLLRKVASERPNAE